VVQDIRDLLQVRLPEDLDDWLNILIYGEPGSGKTYQIGTAADHPNTSPVLLLDIEGGTRTIRSRTDVDIIRIRSIKQLQDVQNKLFRSISADTGKMYYKTLGLDSLGELAQLDMKDIMAAAFNKNPDTTDLDVPSPREWGKTRSHMRDIVRAFRDLPCNTIFTAHSRTREEEGQPSSYFPNFSGQLRSDIPGLVDMVGYLHVDLKGGMPIRKIQFAQTRRVLAKDRTGVFGLEVIDPSIPKLWNMINNTEEPNVTAA